MKNRLTFYGLYIITTIIIFLVIFQSAVHISSEYSIFYAAKSIHDGLNFLHLDEIEISIVLILLFGIGSLMHAIFVSTALFQTIYTKEKLNGRKYFCMLTQTFKRNVLNIIFLCVFFTPLGFWPVVLESILILSIAKIYTNIPLEKKRYSLENILDHDIE